MRRILYLTLFLAGILPLRGNAQSSYVATLADSAFSAYSGAGIIHPIGYIPWADPVQIGPDAYVSAFIRDSFYIIQRHNGNGRPIWTKAIKPTTRQIHIPFYLIRTADNNVVFINDYIYDFGSSNAASVGITKISPDGDILYMRKLVTSTTAGVTTPAPTADSGFIIGASGCIGFNYVFKFDKNGSVSWYGQYGQPGTPTYQYGTTYAVRQTRQGHYKVTGRVTDGIEAFDLDAQGNILKGAYFQRPGGGPFFTSPYTLVQSAEPDGSFFLAGAQIDYSGTTSSARSLFVARLDTNNNLLWSKRMLWADSTQMYDPRLHVLPDGNILIATNKYHAAGPYPSSGVALIRMSKNGQFQSARQLGRDSLNQIRFEQNYGSLFLPYDSSILLLNTTEYGGQLSRQKAYATSTGAEPGACYQEELSMISYDYPLVRYAFLGGGPAGVWPTAPLTYTVQDIQASAVYNCGDTVTYAGPMAVQLAQQEQSLSMYPNPAQNELFLTLDHAQGSGRVAVLTATGALVYDRQILFRNGKASLMLTALPQGLYTIRVSLPGKTAVFGKLLIQQ